MGGSVPASSGDSRERSHGEDRGIQINQEEIRGYLDMLRQKGRSQETIRMYEAKLKALVAYLPPSGYLMRGSLLDWRETLLQSYSPRTVNTCLSAANGLLEYLDRRDLQLLGQLETGEELLPELTRAEYLRLLQAAKALGRERTYLLIKVFALIGPQVRELPQITVEAVQAGRVLRADQGARQSARIPSCLQEELLNYIRRTGIRSGPVFITRNGNPLRRTQVTAEICTLCRDAQVDAEKCNPRCLRKLYRTTRENVEHRVHLLAEQSYERMLNTEQLVVGWDSA